MIADDVTHAWTTNGITFVRTTDQCTTRISKKIRNALSDGGVTFETAKPPMSPCRKREKTRRVARTKVARTKVARTKVARTKAARTKAARTKVARTKAARTKAARTKAARTKAARTKAARAKAARAKAARAKAADTKATIDNTEPDGVEANATRTDAPYFAGVHSGKAVWECPGDQVVHLDEMGAHCAPALIKNHYARLREDRGRLYATVLKHLEEVVSEYQYAERVVVDYIHRVPDADEALYIVELAKEMEQDLHHYTSAVTSCAHNTFENSTAMECLNIRMLMRRLDTISDRMKRQLKRFRALTRDLVDWTSGRAWFRAAKDRAFQLGAMGARTFARMAKLAYRNWGKIWIAWWVFTGGASALAELAMGIVMESTWKEVLLVAAKAILYTCCARAASGAVHYALATTMACLFVHTRESLKQWLANSTVIPRWLVQAALKRIKQMEEYINDHDVKTATMMLAMMYMPSIGRALAWLMAGTCKIFKYGDVAVTGLVAAGVGHVVTSVSGGLVGLVAATGVLAVDATVDFVGKQNWKDRTNMTSEELTAMSDVQAYRVILLRVSRLLSVFTVGGKAGWDAQNKSKLTRAEAPFTDSITGQYAAEGLVQTTFEAHKAAGAHGNDTTSAFRGNSHTDHGQWNVSQWIRYMAGYPQEAPVAKRRTRGMYLNAHDSTTGSVMKTVRGFDELSVSSQKIVQTLGDSVLYALYAPLRSLGLSVDPAAEATGAAGATDAAAEATDAAGATDAAAEATDAAGATDATGATDAAGATPAAALLMYILLGGILIMVVQDPAGDEERQSIMQWVEVHRTATGATAPDPPPVPGGVSFRGHHAR